MTLNLNSKIVMTQIALTSPDLNKANLQIKQELNPPVEAKLEITLAISQVRSTKMMKVYFLTRWKRFRTIHTYRIKMHSGILSWARDLIAIQMWKVNCRSLRIKSSLRNWYSSKILTHSKLLRTKVIWMKDKNCLGLRTPILRLVSGQSSRIRSVVVIWARCRSLSILMTQPLYCKNVLNQWSTITYSTRRQRSKTL